MAKKIGGKEAPIRLQIGKTVGDSGGYGKFNIERDHNRYYRIKAGRRGRFLRNNLCTLYGARFMGRKELSKLEESLWERRALPSSGESEQPSTLHTLHPHNGSGG
ncbi:MAG: hypothetical protein HQK89_00440 [Nitrospirae bacterium]|nr:hypothetical protein [Nitrospirota bacterium]